MGSTLSFLSHFQSVVFWRETIYSNIIYWSIIYVHSKQLSRVNKTIEDIFTFPSIHAYLDEDIIPLFYHINLFTLHKLYLATKSTYYIHWLLFSLSLSLLNIQIHIYNLHAQKHTLQKSEWAWENRNYNW